MNEKDAKAKIKVTLIFITLISAFVTEAVSSEDK